MLHKLWDEIIQDSLSYQKEMDYLVRKQIGAYYTGMDLASMMIEDLFKHLSDEEINNIASKKFLEPCVGSGNFVFAYLRYIHENIRLDKEEIEEIIYNIYVCDADQGARELYFKNLTRLSQELFDIKIGNDYLQNIGEALIFNMLDDEIEYKSIESIFPNMEFDIVVTNPPYKNLRAEINHYNEIGIYEKDKFRYSSVKKFINEGFPLSKGGTLNLFKLFVEEIFTSYTSKNAIVSLLLPSSILTDKSCYNLRSFILKENKVLSITNIKENNRFIDAQQALTAILIKKGEKTDDILVNNDIDNMEERVTIEINDIICEHSLNSIIVLEKSEYDIIKKMNSFPRLKEYQFIHNLRGELDLSINKSCFGSMKTKYKLLRGRNISKYYAKINDISEYVSENFIKNSSKGRYIKKPRIVCQQVVNVNKEQRLSFALIDSEIVLANSCNFISVDNNNEGVTLYYLLGLLNSNLMNWYFKQYSSNNHINNYELDALPIPVHDKEKMFQIDMLVRRYLEHNSEDILEEIEEIVLKLFGLKKEKTQFNNIDGYEISIYKLFKNIEYIVPSVQVRDIKSLSIGNLSIEAFSAKYGLSKHEENIIKGILIKNTYNDDMILNHTSFKMSDLDMEIIQSVPQGGNWRDIPQETMNKSKRLLGIQKTGGRTTLYGRMDYNKPSYTITTYFNRPGNGTYIHPIHDRVISVREAARLQGFQDDYYFFGNQRQVLNQIGNAVPPLIGYQIGRKIVDKTGYIKSLDLFTGAGGFVTGFKQAGIEATICNDIEESACISLKINHPEINVLCADIQLQETKDKLIEVGLKEEVDIICGGPPCQGFSMAGFRDVNDPRNQLFRDFVEVVKHVKPKIIVFENVQGILTLKKGEIYKEIIELFSALDYNLEGRLLNFDEYAVPQRRKRVILIGTRKGLNIMPYELFPEQLTLDEAQKITIFDAISDLENIEPNGNEKYNDSIESHYVSYLKGKISIEDYLKRYQINHNILEQLSLF